ncbi:asparagine synthase (glutamine-hydrolyzing) [Dyella acidiphila]|uniref:asparagine synthase (glutamine-hydrolyzing) n=1 Tax=Dyella acidiphila TaxID=2775866 RepID=A0ABR9G8Q3_9GAMM|nr:asparagine synthase (glutamine-hydrolyzing) [Dyella acidiphila]MBE1160432.1 asparagine synthase (glutamine-hydrolyzing) [Dyella acidiphila]
MCGIAGIAAGHNDTQHVLSKMLDRLQHRGPDDAGIWSGDHLSLGHRRLSIVDLSPAGHQPMLSASGDRVLVYNGEIYNFEDLRQELEHSSQTRSWRGHSDTEVLLTCIETWGVQRTLERCNGMFAFALWNKADKTLVLARDRMGEKPLYFGWVSGRFAFASELKALREVTGWSPQMNLAAISSFLSAGYVRGPHSAIEGIYRLPAGSMLTLSATDLSRPMSWEELSSRLAQYWSLEQVALVGLSSDQSSDPAELLNSLDRLLHDSIARRMVADVPVGAFLSGGIDSSLVTAIMQAQSNRPIRTFSIGFHDSSHNEAHHAKAVAKHLGTDHTELYLEADDALALVPSLAETFDEPFADSSQLPTLLVSKLARQSVTVALSGDGGDELFAGYGRYLAILQLWKHLHRLPTHARHAARHFLFAAAGASSIFSGSLPPRLRRLGERIQFDDIDDLRVAFIAGAGFTRIQDFASVEHAAHARLPSAIQSPLRRLLYGDQHDYLADDILHKVDRASMAYSLESRIPLLDHRIVELSWRFGEGALLAGGLGKQPLRKLLDRHVPFSLIDRPKQGFSPPIAQWLRGPLRDWAETLLSEQSLRELPLINAAEVRKLWAAHIKQKIDAGLVLWNILMLCHWRSHMQIGRGP